MEKGYSPKGKAPVLRQTSRKDRINMIYAITNQGKIRFMFYKETMNSKRLITFMKRLIKNASSEMLSINREYFSLTGGLDRRLYELARKHCGNQDIRQIGIEKLWHKSGSGGTLRKFRYILANHTGDLIDYCMKIDKKKELVTFKRKGAKERILSVFMSEEEPPLKGG